MQQDHGDMNKAEEPTGELEASAKDWCDMLKDAEKSFSTWHDKCDNIAKLYADLKRLAGETTEREMKLFWANVEVLKPTIYARPPQPVVKVRHSIRKPVPRAAAIMVERCLATNFDLRDIHSTLLEARDDLALFGRGATWVRYKTEGQVVEPDPNTLQDGEGQDEPEVEGFEEYTCYDHVNRKEFLHEPVRTWREVGWVARASWLTAKEGKRRFGKQWTGVTYTEDNKDTAEEYKVDKKAKVWEIWHKGRNTVVWVHEGCDHVLDEREPWLKLEGFFPCPKPAYATREPESLTPVPDFLFYKDQIEEVNEYTERISALAEGLRLKGFYSAGGEDIGNAVETALQQTDNNAVMIPVPSVAAMGQGMKDSIVWMPIREVAETITSLIQLRKQVIEDIYQISGISDIMRGETQASETATAQNIKTQYGNVRVRERQNEMIRLADQMMSIDGEIMSENFQPETMLSMSQMENVLPMQVLEQHKQMTMQHQQAAQMAQQGQQQPPQPGQPPQPAPQVPPPPPPLPRDAVSQEEVFALLRNEKMRPFILQTASDSTVQPNEDAEKQRRNEYAQAVGGLFAQAGPVVQSFPPAGALFGEMLKFVSGAYRAGREMESVIDDFTDQMMEMAKAPKDEGPSPEQIKAQAETKRMEMQQQIDGQKAQVEGQKMMMEARTAQMEAANKQREMQMQGAMDQMRMAHEQQMAGMTERLKEMDITIKELAVEAARAKPKPNGSASHERRT